MKSIKDLKVEGRRVLVRCDFNVSLDEEGGIVDDLRLRQALPTINYLREKKAKIVLMSHFKEPEKKWRLEDEKKEKLSTSIYPIKKRLEQLLESEIFFVGGCVGREVQEKINELGEGEILLLENVRAYEEEKEASEDFAQEIAKQGDVFINDAFSVSHRDHATVSKIPLFLESGMGVFFEEELEILKKLVKNPRQPVVAVVGGAKVESKIKALNFFLEEADHLLLGGKIANMVLIVRGVAINLKKPPEEVTAIVKEMDYTSPKLHLPVDVVTSRDNKGESGVAKKGPGKVEEGEDIYDIGEETINLFGDIIKNAGTIIWAGPLGLSEVEAFSKGTKSVGRHVIENKEAVKIVGGGDTLKAFRQFDLIDEIDLVSSGGGAMLAFITGGAMPGIEALKLNREKNEKLD